MAKKNIVLIGMPSSGKSTVGKRLSDALHIPFIDTDELIYRMSGKSPRDIVAEDGLESFLALQEKAALSINAENSIIATGGSIVYSHAAMEHLRLHGTIVFLHADVNETEQRIASGRRLAKRDGQSFKDIYQERLPLYRKYADITVNCPGKSEQEIAEEIIKAAEI